MTAVRAHLWTHSPAPLEYIELLCCRDIYHCPPSQLPPWHIIQQHLEMISIESEVSKRKNK
jgi:hypothetical protein